MKGWLPEVDILKATAILLILFGHMDSYISCASKISTVGNYAAIMGLSLFFFCSGFLLSRRESFDNFRNSLLPFYLKKFIRLYPLYWIALFFYMVVRGFGLFDSTAITISLNDIFLYIFGLNGIFFTPNGCLWFVGVLILFLLLYPIISIFSKNLKQLLLISIIIFILLNIFNYFLGLIDPRALRYFPIFIAGIFIDRLDRMGINYPNKKFVMISIFSSSLFIFSGIFLIKENIFNFPTLYLKNILLIGILISICCLFLSISSLILPINPKIMKLISLISFGTYAIYLFHEIILEIFTQFTHYFIENEIIQDIFIVTVGFWITVLLGILIQNIERKIISPKLSRFIFKTKN